MKLLVIDLSTTCTGFAIFTDGKLIRYDKIIPKVPGLSKMKYPEAVYHRNVNTAAQIKELVIAEKPDTIVIEEVNRGINRIAQKGLDACHFFVLGALYELDPTWLKRVIYIDSNGKKGWRGLLGLKLSEEDKEQNKKIRAINKKSKLKYAVIDWKVLAQRYVKKVYNLDFDVVNITGDSDICDAICVGHAYLTKVLK